MNINYCKFCHFYTHFQTQFVEITCFWMWIYSQLPIIVKTLCCPKSKSCRKFIWSLLRIMFIFISLLKFHGQASRRRNTNGSKQFFKATNIFKVGAESWCTFQFSHIIQFARHFSNLMCWLSSYKANFKCELTNCQFFLKSCIDNSKW